MMSADHRQASLDLRAPDPSTRTWLEIRARRNPEAVAIAAPGRVPLRYERLMAHVHMVVGKLNSLGVGRNDRVGVVVPNGPEMAVAFMSVAAGATIAPINPAYQGSECDSCLAGLNARALIVQDGFDSAVRDVARKRKIPIIELSPILEAEAGIFALRGDERPCSVGGFATGDDIALMLHTSGTTARPKLVPLTHGSIYNSAVNIQRTLLLRETDRCLNVMPLFHIHGLVGAVLSSLVAGGSVVCVSGFSAARFFEDVEEFRPTWYTAVPTIHQAILARAELRPEVVRRCSFRFIRSSSSALSPRVMSEMERMFRVPVIESYGMTEAAHQIASNPLPPGERKLGSVGVAAGPEIAIMRDAGGIAPPGEVGEIVVRGATVMPAYAGDPADSAGAFAQGWFRTGDQGYLDCDGYLFITGRTKEVINRGGSKISPREVEEVLIEHPAIAEAVTFAIPHSQLGEDVGAAVVLRRGVQATEGDIRRYAASRLADFKVPRRVVILDEISKGVTGKLERVGLAGRLGLSAVESERPDLRDAYLAPRDALETQLVGIWEKVLKVRRVGIRDDFFALGGYSLLAVELVEEILKRLRRALPVASLLQAPNVEQQADLLRREEASVHWPSLVPIQPLGTSPPLFCVHEVLGGVLFYGDLARYLGSDQPVYGLQPRGLDKEQAPHTRIEDMATQYTGEIRALQPDGPYLLAGFSFGGKVAFEMARQLHAQGQEVGLLALFDTHGPGYPRRLPLTVSRFGEVASRHFCSLKQLSFRDRVIYVLKGMRRIEKRARRTTRKRILGAVYRLSATVQHPLPRAIRNVGAADRLAAKQYVPQVHPGRVTLFRAAEQPSGVYPDPTLGWGRLAAGGLEVHDVPGDHGTVVREPNLRFLAEVLKSCIARAQAAGDRRADA